MSGTAIKRLLSLMHWVKDQEKIGAVMRFSNGNTQGVILAEIADATVRERCRKTQMKSGESLITNEFWVKLKNSAQWQRWKEDLKTTLSLVIGTKGVPLLYVIRANDTPQNNANFT